MYVITVIPIARGILVDELSYFAPESAPEGGLVSVPLRGRRVNALVVSCIPAAEAKAEIKQAGFALKKLEKIEAQRCFAPAFVEAVEQTAAYFASTRGAVLQAVFPTPLLREVAPERTETKERSREHGECFVVQAEDAERQALYKSLIREMFAKGESVFLALPSIQDIEHIYGEMERGIREYTFILHGGISQGELKKRWKAAIGMKHPILLIGTAFFLGIPRDDIAAIIVDRESSSAYRVQGRPFIDLRFFAESYAIARGAKLVMGDIVLRTETFARMQAREFEPLTRPKSRLISTARQELVDMRVLGEQPATGRFAIYSPALVDRIEENRAQGTQSFLLGIRRGYAPMTVCGDCGTVVLCKECSAPVVLHKRQLAVNSAQFTGNTEADGVSPLPPSKGEGWDGGTAHPHELQTENCKLKTATNVFLCQRCGHERPADFTCAHCGGWRLTTLGIGIAQAAEALKGRFPDLPLFHIDRDTTPTHKDALRVAEEFYATPGAVMLGTEMAIPYLTKPLATVGVLSVNSLLTIPDFRMGEKVFRLLLTLRAKADRHFVVQTRDTKDPVFALATGGNIGEFTRSELEARKALGYPPYSTLIKLTHEGSKPDGERAMTDIERIFAPFNPVTFPSFIARVKGKYRMNALLKIPAGKWPDPEIATLLRALPSEIEVRVDPESVI